MDQDKTDIVNRQDIDVLMEKFYEKMMVDPFIGYIFTHYANVDLQKHLPVISDFWETVLFQNPVYKRGPEAMNVHLDLHKVIPFRKQHFTRWLYLFHSTIDEMFEGETATKAKTRSQSIARLIQERLGTLPDCREM